MSDKIIRIVSIILVAILVIAIAFPFVVMLSISLQSKTEIFSLSANLIPDKWLFSNYKEAMESAEWLRYFANSMIGKIPRNTIGSRIRIDILIKNDPDSFSFLLVDFQYSVL